MGTAAARRTVTGGGRFKERFLRHGLLHLEENAPVSGHNQLFIGQRLRCFDELGGRASHIGQLHNSLRRLRVDKHGGIRIQTLQVLNAFRLELLVHDAGTVPHQHVGTGFFLNIATQMLIRCPQNLFTLRLQVLNDLHGNRRGHDPIGTRFYRRRGIGIHHHGTVGVGIAERAELVNRAANIERAGRFERRHQHTLFWGKDLGRFAHKAHACNHQRGGIVTGTEAGHFQGVRHTAASLFSKLLNGIVGIVMRYQNGVVRLE